MEGDMLLIGIGCNVLFAPNVNKTTNNAHASALIRSATCLADYNPVYAEVAAHRMKLLEEQNNRKQLDQDALQKATKMVSASSPTARSEPPPFTIAAGDFHKELAVELCDNLYTWLHAGTDTAGLVHQDFTANMDYSPQRLRDEPNEELGTVIPTGLNPDGTLNVRFGSCLLFFFLVHFFFAAASHTLPVQIQFFFCSDVIAVQLVLLAGEICSQRRALCTLCRILVVITTF